MRTSSSETIVALSSGSLPAGVAVVRLSGPAVGTVLQTMIQKPLSPRKAELVFILDPSDGSVLDQGFVLWFPAPDSYTGEDVAEFHVHGSRAVVSLLLERLCEFDGVRLAEAGEFTRRGFENGKFDLTVVDGLADLLASETEAQRRLALSQSQGALRDLYEGWRLELIRARAMIEAELDFADEEDVPSDISEAGLGRLQQLSQAIRSHLDDRGAGEIIRDGFQIALMGAPNAGKSSLLNALAKRDVAIVSDVAGTTRDVIAIDLDVNGYKVTILDTAGIRDTEDAIEVEGVSRAVRAGESSDLVLWLAPVDEDVPPLPVGVSDRVLLVRSKDDSASQEFGGISSETGHGFDWLMGEIAEAIATSIGSVDTQLVTRQRYRTELGEAAYLIDAVIEDASLEVELKSENLRLAGDHIGRITGKIDIEDLLDVIFSEFCVGK